MIRFNANLFRVAFAFASSEETRYYLKGVFVEPHSEGGVTLTATDGHRLISIRDGDGAADEKAIVKLGDALKQCKPKRGERRDVVIETGSDTASVVVVHEANDGTKEDEPVAVAFDVRIDGSYPDYRRIVPLSCSSDEAPGLSGEYVASFGKAARELSNGNKTASVRVLSGGMGSPALILFPGFEDALGVLMPVRVGGSSTRAPSWFRAV